IATKAGPRAANSSSAASSADADSAERGGQSSKETKRPAPIRSKTVATRAACSYLFRRSGHRRVFVGAASASQFHAGPSGGQIGAGACRDGGGVGRATPRRREGLLAREHVPGGDQDLARDGGLGRVLARALGDVGVELVPRVRRAPGLMGGLDGGPAQRPRAGLGQRTGAERSPDWLISGARPA